MRWSVTRWGDHAVTSRLALFLLAPCLVLGACGDAAEPAPEVPMEESECLSCGVESQRSTRTVEAIAHVAVAPTQLMFYSMYGTGEAAPQLVRLTNLTRRAVWITDVYVAEDTRRHTGQDGQGFFHVTIPADLPARLSPNDELALEVSFAPTSVQRQALLVVEQTFDGSVMVPLSGKVIVQSGFGD